MKWTESRLMLRQVLIKLFRTLYCSIEADLSQAICLPHYQSLWNEGEQSTTRARCLHLTLSCASIALVIDQLNPEPLTIKV